MRPRKFPSGATLAAAPGSDGETPALWDIDTAQRKIYEQEMGFSPHSLKPGDPGYEQWSLTMNSRKGVENVIKSALRDNQANSARADRKAKKKRTRR